MFKPHKRDMSGPNKMDMSGLRGDFFRVVLTQAPSGDLTIDVSQIADDVDITVITAGAIKLMPPNPEQGGAISTTVTKQAYNIGDVLPDGWVVGPRSPKTGIVMAIEPVSGALDGYKTWHQGQVHAAELRDQGHANARQPSADNNNDELNAIYNDVVKAGRNGNAKLNRSGSNRYGIYWSGTTNTNPGHWDHARVQYFGWYVWYVKAEACALVRCVRDEPGVTLAEELGHTLA